MKIKSPYLLLFFLFLAFTIKAQNKQAAKQLSIQPLSQYLLYLPGGYEKAAYKSWPLVLFLHGSGEKGDSLGLVKKNGLPKLIAEGKEFPFIVASPQCPAGRRWSVADLNLLLDELMKDYNIDPDRVYLTGLSMGGFGTWDLATSNPERFAAIAPVCGGGDPAMACRLKDVPAWVFHGAKDDVVMPYRSKEMVEALKKCGGEVKFTLYPEANHDSWSATYANPELYDWLLQHKRKNKWAEELEAFDKNDAMNPDRKNVILFTGSSSVRKWTSLQKDLKNKEALNRGFGGSTYADLLKNIDRIVFRYHPEKIFIYSGDNDIAAGLSAAQTFTDFKNVFRTIRERLPETNLYIISAKPSPSRGNLMPEMQQFNTMLQQFLSQQPKATFIDVYHPMLNENGKPKPNLFAEDNLHMNDKGYALWTSIIKPYVE